MLAAARVALKAEEPLTVAWLSARAGVSRATFYRRGRSGVSRATLYRLFPGKAALFRELVRTYSPLEPVVATLTRLGDGPPEEVMPELARAAARKVHPWLGVACTLFFEFTTTSPEALEGAQLVFSQGLGPVARYLSGQMAAGRLRPLHPLLALQAFVGPPLPAPDHPRALRLVELEDRRHAVVAELSGGMRTRVSLACAVVHRPRLLLLDEPTVGVDPQLRAQLWERFRAMTAEGSTIVVSSHVMDEAERCDRLGLIRAGRLLAEGSADELKRLAGVEQLEAAFLRLSAEATPA